MSEPARSGSSSGITTITNASVDEVERSLAATGARVFVLGDGILTKQAFFDAIRNVLPLVPPVDGNSSWEALSDSLFEGLHQLPDSHIAIVWPNTSLMASSQPDDFAIATDILAYISATIPDPSLTRMPRKELSVTLIDSATDR